MGSSPFKIKSMVAETFKKKVKVLQKGYIFTLHVPFGKFWGYLSENAATLLPNILNYLIFNNNNG